MPVNFKNTLNISRSQISNALEMLRKHINQFDATGLSLHTPSKHENSSDFLSFHGV